MKRELLLFALLFLVLLVVSGQKGCKKQEKLEFDVQGLTMNFVEDAPPTEMVSLKSYPIYVDIQNDGGSDIAAGEANFYLSGFSPTVLSNVNTKLTNSGYLNKKTEFQQGGKERLVFATNAVPAKLQAPFSFTLRLDSCYRYSTFVHTSICIGKKSGVCSLEGNKITSNANSAAPVQVTSLTERVEGSKLYVEAIIENKGKGKVYLPTTNCDLLQQNDVNEKLKENMLEVSVSSEEGFKCFLQTQDYRTIESTEGIASLGKLTCYKEIGDEQTRAVPFDIVLSYVYVQSITKNFKIIP